MSTPVEALIKAFKDFIGRDLIYIVAGGQVVGAFLYCFESVPAATDSWVLFVLLGGVGYFVAYALQDLLSLFRVLPTVPVRKPCGFLRWIYKLYTRQECAVIGKELSPDEHRALIAAGLHPELERLVMLQQIGTTGGPCIVLCGFLFSVAFRASHRPLDLYVGVGGLVLGVLLILLAWLKATQRAQFIARHRADEDAKA